MDLSGTADEKVESPVMIHKTDAGSGGSSEEEYVTVEKDAEPPAAASAAEEDEDEFTPKSSAEHVVARPPDASVAAPRHSARLSVDRSGCALAPRASCKHC